MAGVSTKEIKTRIRSMESTKQITKAMEMVAASKLRKAQNQILNSRPYFEILYSTINEIVDANHDFSSPYLAAPAAGKTAYVVIAGDRGLAGGYNSNVLKLALAEMEGQEAVVLPVGKKAMDYFLARKLPLLTQSYREAEDVSVGDCFTMAKLLCKQYFGDTYAIGQSSALPRKPAPDMVHKAMEAIGAESCIYVGDSEVDVLTAKNAGVPCLSVLWGFRDKEILAEAGATQFCEDPKDLLNALKEMI